MLRQDRMLPDIGMRAPIGIAGGAAIGHDQRRGVIDLGLSPQLDEVLIEDVERDVVLDGRVAVLDQRHRSEEHTSELQSLMRISYAVFCLKKKTTYQTTNLRITQTKSLPRTQRHTPTIPTTSTNTHPSISQ